MLTSHLNDTNCDQIGSDPGWLSTLLHTWLYPIATPKRPLTSTRATGRNQLGKPSHARSLHLSPFQRHRATLPGRAVWESGTLPLHQKASRVVPPRTTPPHSGCESQLPAHAWLRANVGVHLRHDVLVQLVAFRRTGSSEATAWPCLQGPPLPFRHYYVLLPVRSVGTAGAGTHGYAFQRFVPR